MKRVVSAMRFRSLTAATYVRVLLVLVVLSTAATGIAYFIARSEVDKASDRSLISGANMLYALMQEELATSQDGQLPASLLSEEDRLAVRTGEPTRIFAVFRHENLLVSSENGPVDSRIPPIAGFHNFGHDEWRAYGLDVPRHDLLIVVAERRVDIDRGLTTFLHKIAIPIDLLVLISAFVLWGVLHNGLTDMRRLNRQVARRSFHDLEPLDPTEWPYELGALIATLNRLFTRVQAGIAHEQAFTDAAAHQLRTPLAALRLQAEILGRSENIAPERTKSLLDCVDQANDLVTQMLLLARLGATTPVIVRFDLRELVSDVLARHALLASRQGMELSFEYHNVDDAFSDPSLLDLALSALIENAITHAACGGVLEILLARVQHGVTAGIRIDIMDRGPGIPLSKRTEVFSRFYQINSSRGHGLGMSIAAHALGLIDAKIELTDRPNGSGLRASIIIPQ